MTLIPYKSETLVLPFRAEQVVSTIRSVTQPISLTPEKGNDQILFNGTVHPDLFRISRKIDYPQNYLPLITGKIEASSRGCIVFVKYNLFFSSFMFLSFWTLFTLLVGCFFVIHKKEYNYAAVAFGACLANYGVTILNFNKQINMSRRVLNQVLKQTA